MNPRVHSHVTVDGDGVVKSVSDVQCWRAGKMLTRYHTNMARARTHSMVARTEMTRVNQICRKVLRVSQSI